MSFTALPRLSPAQRQVVGVLAEVHDATILEITAAATVSKSTVAKALTLLEEAGAAARTVHADGDVRFADTWSPTEVTGQLLMSAGTGSDEDSVDSTDRDDAFEPDRLGWDQPGSAEICEPRPELEAPPEPVQAAHADTLEAHTVAGLARLEPGGLAQLVAEQLAKNPFTEYTPTMLSHLLGGRSSGAISNALERQVKGGTAVRTCERPRRYRHAGTNPDD